MKTTFFYLILVAAFLSGTSAFAQSLERKVVASAGRSGSGAGISVDYTIGEPLVQTYSAGGNILTQGFHQPASSPVSVEEITEVLNYSVFPNPFSDVVQVSLTVSDAAGVQLKLTDIAGRVVHQAKPADYTAGTHLLSVNTASLAQGSYLLVATVNGPGKIPVSISKRVELIR